MPQTQVVFYASDDGSAPLLIWIDGLPVKVQNKCIVRIERLAQLGYELRRPEADLLRDGIHELRVRAGNVHYNRILYFFHEGQAILSHGCSKEDVVPPVEIDRAIANKTRFINDPARHTYRE